MSSIYYLKVILKKTTKQLYCLSRANLFTHNEISERLVFCTTYFPLINGLKWYNYQDFLEFLKLQEFNFSLKMCFIVSNI